MQSKPRLNFVAPKCKGGILVQTRKSRGPATHFPV